MIIYKKNIHYNKTYTNKDYPNLAYEDVTSFHNRYPKEQGGYRVIGAIGEGVSKVKGKWTYEEKDYDFYEVSYAKLRYKIKGYVEIDADTYLAIVGKDYAKLIQLFLGIIIVICLGVGGWYLSQKEPGPDIDPGSSKFEPKTELNENSDPTKIALPGYGDLQMYAGAKEAYVALWNPDTNPCYFKFQITMDDSQEVIYESKLIPPGNAVTAVKFNQSFDQGVYPITIRIYTYSLDDHTKSLNGGEIKSRLVAIAKQ